jgi:hypothetical protein
LDVPQKDQGERENIQIGGEMRRKHEVIDGHRISVWDDPQYADRYTVVDLDSLDERGKVQYIGMSADPFNPQGIGMCGEMRVHDVAYNSIRRTHCSYKGADEAQA